ncbi:MAG: hypothetical protein R3310_10355 [Candidatus Competibacteraceae bacterium]|nr:hypothetical protein [Candidatus Competibacteraceae bacterium]
MLTFRYDRLTGMVSGLIVWALYFVVVYSLTGVGCQGGWPSVPVLGTNLLVVTLVGVTVLALTFSLLLGLRGWRGWRGAASPEEPLDERRRFMGLVMLVVSLLAGVAILFTSIPIFMLPPCQ